MSDNVLDRIRQKRQKPSVPLRDDTLVANMHPTATPSEQSEALPLPQAPSLIRNTGSTLEELRAELENIPETNRHSAIVLEKELDYALTRYCKDNRITVEVFLEAAWVYTSSRPEATAQILVEAQQRYAKRKQAGKLRRIITMLEGQS